MKSEASIKGHPIHPMLVAIPIGLWIASLISDLVYLGQRTLFWYDMAWWTMAIGVIGALCAAIPGLVDYTTTVRHSERAYPTARTHMILNLGIVAVYCINLYLRHNYGAIGGGMLGLAVVLSVLCIGVLSVSGWLGGDLVYKYGIGMQRQDLHISMLEADREAEEIHR